MRRLENIVPMTDEQQRESDLIDGGFTEIMTLCQQMGMSPSENIQIQFRLVLYGVLRMSHNVLEKRIAALEAFSFGSCRHLGPKE